MRSHLARLREHSAGLSPTCRCSLRRPDGRSNPEQPDDRRRCQELLHDSLPRGFSVAHPPGGQLPYRTSPTPVTKAGPRRCHRSAIHRLRTLPSEAVSATAPWSKPADIARVHPSGRCRTRAGEEAGPHWRCHGSRPTSTRWSTPESSDDRSPRSCPTSNISASNSTASALTGSHTATGAAASRSTCSRRKACRIAPTSRPHRRAARCKFPEELKHLRARSSCPCAHRRVRVEFHGRRCSAQSSPRQSPFESTTPPTRGASTSHSYCR